MNYPCHPNLIYLSDGASSQSDESTVFNEAVGAFIIECANLNWPMVCPASARFKKYAFRAGWGSEARLEASRVYYAPIRAALAAMGK